MHPPPCSWGQERGWLLHGRTERLALRGSMAVKGFRQSNSHVAGAVPCLGPDEGPPVQIPLFMYKPTLVLCSQISHHIQALPVAQLTRVYPQMLRPSFRELCLCRRVNVFPTYTTVYWCRVRIFPLRRGCGLFLRALVPTVRRSPRTSLGGRRFHWGRPLPAHRFVLRPDPMYANFCEMELGQNSSIFRRVLLVLCFLQ